jgi:hypothetical protein
MPYRISKQGNQWCVVKDDATNKKMGCHETKGDAESQLKALYANEPEAEVEALFQDTHDALGEGPNLTHRAW